MIRLKKYGYVWLRALEIVWNMSITFFQYVGKHVKDFHWQKVW